MKGQQKAFEIEYVDDEHGDRFIALRCVVPTSSERNKLKNGQKTRPDAETEERRTWLENNVRMHAVGLQTQKTPTVAEEDFLVFLQHYVNYKQMDSVEAKGFMNGWKLRLSALPRIRATASCRTTLGLIDPKDWTSELLDRFDVAGATERDPYPCAIFGRLKVNRIGKDDYSYLIGFHETDKRFWVSSSFLEAWAEKGADNLRVILKRHLQCLARLRGLTDGKPVGWQPEMSEEQRIQVLGQALRFKEFEEADLDACIIALSRRGLLLPDPPKGDISSKQKRELVGGHLLELFRCNDSEEKTTWHHVVYTYPGVTFYYGPAGYLEYFFVEEIRPLPRHCFPCYPFPVPETYKKVLNALRKDRLPDPSCTEQSTYEGMKFAMYQLCSFAVSGKTTVDSTLDVWVMASLGFYERYNPVEVPKMCALLARYRDRLLIAEGFVSLTIVPYENRVEETEEKAFGESGGAYKSDRGMESASESERVPTTSGPARNDIENDEGVSRFRTRRGAKQKNCVRESRKRRLAAPDGRGDGPVPPRERKKRRVPSAPGRSAERLQQSRVAIEPHEESSRKREPAPVAKKRERRM